MFSDGNAFPLSPCIGKAFSLENMKNAFPLSPCIGNKHFLKRVRRETKFNTQF